MMQLRALLAYARPYRAELLALAALMCASSLLLLAVPWLAGRTLGYVALGQGAPVIVAVLLVLCLALVSGINFALGYQAAGVSARLLANVRCRLYDHVQRLPLRFHQQRSKGDTLAAMTVEVERLGHFLTSTLVALPARMLVALGAMLVMFRLEPHLAIIVPLLIPPIFLMLKIVGRRQRKLAEAIRSGQARLVALSEEALEILPATKAFTREAVQSEQFAAAAQVVRGTTTRMDRIQAALEPSIGFLAAIAALAILLLAEGPMRSGRMTAPELFSFIFYAALLTRPLGGLADLYGQVQMARGALARLQAIFDEPGEGGGSAASSGKARGLEIVFDSVAFGYAGRAPVLRGATFRVGAGEIVALSGANGSGKTSIINLLMRFYEPQEGRIEIGGQPIAEMDVAQLRGLIGLVPQSTVLLNGSIRENIAFGTEHATPAMIWRAAELAQADGFIADLPDGLDTLIGDRGVRLSGGQRQRIALARALIKDPPILILDEATSMFDEEGEAAFVAARAGAIAGRTVILITHRPALLALADRVVELEGGTTRQVVVHQRRAGSQSC